MKHHENTATTGFSLEPSSNIRSIAAWVNQALVWLRKNRSEVSGLRTTCCPGDRTVLGSVVGAGDSQYLSWELHRNEPHWWQFQPDRDFSPNVIRVSHKVLTKTCSDVGLSDDAFRAHWAQCGFLGSMVHSRTAGCHVTGIVFLLTSVLLPVSKKSQISAAEAFESGCHLVFG